LACALAGSPGNSAATNRASAAVAAALSAAVRRGRTPKPSPTRGAAYVTRIPAKPIKTGLAGSASMTAAGGAAD
jgi:hypothetical protein